MTNSWTRRRICVTVPLVRNDTKVFFRKQSGLNPPSSLRRLAPLEHRVLICPFFLWQLLIMHIQQNCVIYNSSFRCLLGSVRSHFPAFQNVHSRLGKYVTRHSSRHFRSSNNCNYTFGLRVEIAPVEVFRGSVTE